LAEGMQPLLLATTAILQLRYARKRKHLAT
jgi:hypothetical protein